MKKINLKGELLKLKFKKDYNGDVFLFRKNTEIVNDYEEIDGNIYTESQIDELLHDGEIFICEDCGGYFFMDDSYYIEDENKHVCGDCIGNYYYCEDCENYFTRDNIHYIEDTDIYICDNCFDSGYYGYCEDCGECFTTDALHYCEDDECYYCDNCYDGHKDNNNIYGYHNFDDWRLYKLNDNDKDFYIGYELEIDNGNAESTATQVVYENLNAVCMHDGSLYDGFEIVSHPQTYNYIMEHKDILKDVMKKLIDCGYESHNANTCGLHFHVTAPKENRHEIVARLWAIIEFYKNEVVKLSRRTDSQFHWCKWLSDDRDLKSIEYYHIKGMAKDYTRYLAINDTNYKTIEFRFFRGTLNYKSFMAAVQFIHNLYTLASDLSIKLQDITWNRLTEGEFINEYVNERNILTTDVIIDNYEAISTYDYYLQFFFKRVFKMLEKKQKDFYKEQIEKLQNTKDLDEIRRRVDYMDSMGDTVTKISNAKNLIIQKDYKKAYDILENDIVNYIIYSKNGNKDMKLLKDGIKENIEKLEGVILCA